MQRYWVIAPYESNNLWEKVWKYDLEHRVISIGWQTLGDVSALGEDQLAELIDLTYPTKTPLKKRYLFRTFHTFYRSIKIGDIIVASRGRSIIAGVGTVVGTAHYAHQKNIEVLGSEWAHSNYLSVRWHDEPRDKTLPGLPFPRRTLSKISEQKFHELTNAPSQTIITRPESEHGSEEGESVPSFHTATEPKEISSSESVDPVPNIGTLLSSNQKLISVTRDSEVRRAIYLMSYHRCSQLPVMQGTRSAGVKGWISWKSITKATFDDKECKLVRDCMEEDKVEIIREDTPLLEAIKTIREKEAVLVQNRVSEIIGAVTHREILTWYNLLAEGFLLLGEIENYLRQLITSAGYSLLELQAAKNPNENSRQIESVSNLTFGEYINLFERTDKWALRHNNVHIEDFLSYLRVVNKIRNAVMHFRPKPISEEELNELRNTVRFMRSLK